MNPFVESFYEDAIFLEIEVANCFLQISHASVHHLRGRAGSAAREIFGLKLHCLQTAKLRIQRAAGTCRTASDYAYIESLPFNSSQGLLASFHAPTFLR